MSLTHERVATRLLFLVNCPAFFVSHRLPIALAAMEAGYEVHVATAPGLAAKNIIKEGIIFHEIPFSRSGKNPIKELLLIFSIRKLMSDLRPDLVHLVTIKPVIYGGMVARLVGVPSVVAAVSGLGYVFVARDGKDSFAKKLVSFLYRIALGHRNLRVIFQNPDDKSALESVGAIEDSQARMICGSGVALQDCPYESEPNGQVVVTMAARLLKDKGVNEFVDAARIISERNVDVTFRLIGSVDPGNPTSVTERELDQWREEGVVEILGFRNDVPQQYASSHIVCLPSYYGEGLPKSLVEAAACGRAVVTTDMPGCRDAIEPGRTGLLVPPRDAIALANVIQRLVENPEKRQAMGRAGRDLAERDFAIDKVVQAHLNIYQELEAGVCKIQSHAKS